MGHVSAGSRFFIRFRLNFFTLCHTHSGLQELNVMNEKQTLFYSSQMKLYSNHIRHIVPERMQVTVTIYL